MDHPNSVNPVLDSPFSPFRFEHGGRLFFLTPENLARLRVPGVLRLYGTRGTGKTTLLRSLYWRDRIQNPSLREALDDDPFGDGIVGMYFAVPRSHLQTIDRACRDAPDDVFARLFSVHLELLWIEAAAEAVVGIAVAEEMDIDPAHELERCQAALEILGQLDVAAGMAREPTLEGVRQKAESLRRDIEAAADTATSWETIFETVRIGPVLQVGPPVLGHLMQLLGAADPRGRTWVAKACVDEGEFLTERQRRAVNTLMRLVELPLLPVFAFLGIEPAGERTLLEGGVLQRHDRQELDLDELADDEFEQLCRGVARLRLEAEKHTGESDLDPVLGPFGINRLLTHVFGLSVSDTSRELAAEAERLAERHPWLKDETDEALGTAPIYQAYLVRELERDLDAAAHRSAQAQTKAEIRKGMVAAYLSICRDLGADLRFSSLRMLLQLCDKSIRDFLWQVHEIYLEVRRPIDAFMTSTVGIEAQTKAIRKASREKAAVPQRILAVAPRPAALLIHGLADLTRRLQTHDPDGSHLRSPERGVFKVKKSGDERAWVELTDMLVDAHTSGFLRMIELSSDAVRFRVHTSLAAHYGFSYRGAYYEVRLGEHDLAGMARARDQADVEARAEAIWRRLGPSEQEQLPGFESL